MPDPVLVLDQICMEAPTSDKGRLSNLGFQVEEGEIFSILGMNVWERGALLDLICGLVEPVSGSLRFKGREMPDAPEKERNRMRGRMGLVTHPPRFLNNVRIMENLRLPLRYHSEKDGLAIDRLLNEILIDLSLDDFTDRIPSHFDTLFLGAAALARALSVTPQLLVIERPMESLGKRLTADLLPLLKKYVILKGGSVLLLTGGPRCALKLSRRIALFRDGAITAVKDPKTFRAELDDRSTDFLEGSHG